MVDVDVSGALITETVEERERREEETATAEQTTRTEGEEGLAEMKRAEKREHKTVF